ncbi:MAG: serine hydrolase domain-containing protein [Myxococcota bacterium]
MSTDPRRAVLESFLESVVARGFTDRAAGAVYQMGHLVEAHAGVSDPKLEYDLASLTKILCTTYLAAGAVVEQKLDLQETPWPAWPGVTVEHLLAHRSGLPAWREIHSIADVLAVEPTEKPGIVTVYSDIGFMALGDLLEQRLGQKLDHLYAHEAVHFHGPVPVNDANCRALGGVAGHAGLFGTLDAVLDEAKHILKCLKNPESEFEEMIYRFARFPGSRGLGFDKASPEGSGGGVLSEQAVGHLGFTGTSLWIDPVDGAVYILLLRRLDEGQKKDELLEIRRQFHRCLSSRA